MLYYVQNTFVMDRDKLKLLIRQLEFTLDAIKAEVYSDTDAYKNSHAFEQTNDYDELFDDDDEATQTSRARKMLNLLKRLAKQDYLYTEEKLKGNKISD